MRATRSRSIRGSELELIAIERETRAKRVDAILRFRNNVQCFCVEDGDDRGRE